MKTVKFILAAVVMSAMFFSCQKANIEPQSQVANETYLTSSVPTPGEVPPVNMTKTVFYNVNINYVSEKPLCDAYWVVILDGNGHVVAPKQMYMKGTTTYHFTEQVRVTEGVRIARLIRDVNPDISCINHLYTPPAELKITFEDMGKYFFDLYPVENWKNPKD